MAGTNLHVERFLIFPEYKRYKVILKCDERCQNLSQVSANLKIDFPGLSEDAQSEQIQGFENQGTGVHFLKKIFDG